MFSSWYFVFILLCVPSVPRSVTRVSFASLQLLKELQIICPKQDSKDRLHTRTSCNRFVTGSDGRASPAITARRLLSWNNWKRLGEVTNSPSRLPVTISGAPSPIPKPPTPSILFMISLWPFTEYTGISGASKFLGKKKKKKEQTIWHLPWQSGSV